MIFVIMDPGYTAAYQTVGALELLRSLAYARHAGCVWIPDMNPMTAENEIRR